MKKLLLLTIVFLLGTAITANAQVLSSAHSVYFDYNSSSLNKKLKQKVDALVTRLKRAKTEEYEVLVYGYASKDGGTGYNLSLSNRRTQAVYDYLIKSGIPESKVKMKKIPRGEEKMRSKWYKGEPEPQGSKARFVEILITPRIGVLDPEGGRAETGFQKS